MLQVLCKDQICVQSVKRSDFRIALSQLCTIYPSTKVDFFNDATFLHPKDQVLSCGSEVMLFDLKTNSTILRIPRIQESYALV